MPLTCTTPPPLHPISPLPPTPLPSPIASPRCRMLLNVLKMNCEPEVYHQAHCGELLRLAGESTVAARVGVSISIYSAADVVLDGACGRHAATRLFQSVAGRHQPP